jgi:hypothetical protein
VQFDLGPTGLGLLVAASLIFGVIAQLILRSGTHWLWLTAAVGFFGGGLFASEVMFADSTVEDLQPLIDGLFLDEAMFGGLLIGIPVALVTWYVTRRGGRGAPQHPTPAA